MLGRVQVRAEVGSGGATGEVVSDEKGERWGVGETTFLLVVGIGESRCGGGRVRGER